MSTSILIDAASLVTLLKQPPRDLLLLDCRHVLTDPAAGALAYAQGHIPGALHAHLDTVMSAAPTGANGRHPLPDPHTFASRMAELGANDDTLIVTYDAGESVYPARLWWMLRWVGHDSIKILDGGLQAWQAAGGEISVDQPQAQPRGNFSVRQGSMATLSFSDMLANVASKEYLVVDARSADRYRGENETIDPVGGRIPGALNRSFKNNLEADGRFKSPERLREEFLELLGDTPSDKVAHQCGSGVSACNNMLAMELAGLSTGTLYPGSWSEWCRQDNAPVATG